ncbi:Hsp70 family protein [Parvularcula oceani]|uniref:Hsp70 family protein n=1 Tax=Parvularcula oceani TaxID=1247963 RepID=UPI0004E19305|nr:hypothetical protein [Parvularcula oceani]
MANHHLGFDLGHADTAIALASGRETERFAAPANLEVQGQSIQPTALARIKREGKEVLVVGGRAIREVSKAQAQGNAALKAAFKTRPKNLGAATADLQDFFRTMLEEAAFDPAPPEGWAGCSIAVGCPSSWSAEEDARAYAEILREALAGTDMAKAEVSVVPESRAALLQAIENPNSPLTLEARRENILVIDVGSSTLDMSLIAPEQKASPLFDAGLDLGASFFDRRVLDAALADRSDARGFLELNPHYRDLWLYYARRTKEQFFIDAPHDDEEPISGAPLQTFFAGGQRQSLTIDITGEEFATLRRAPYDRPLNPSPELSLDPAALQGMSWEEIYEAALTALREAIARRGSAYGRVLLAGGASRMPFTEEIAQRVFAHGPGDTPVLRDPEPSHMVSRGLSRWSRRQESVERFAVAARKLMKERLPELASENFEPLKDRLATALAGVIFDRFVEPVLQLWKDGAFRTGRDVRAEIETRTAEWLASEEGTDFFVREINAWWREEVKHELDRELDKLHAAFDVSRDIQLNLGQAIDPAVFRFSASSLDLPFEAVIQAALLTLAFAVTIAIDAHFGFVPITTGALAAAVAVGGKPLRAWIARIDVPAFARRLPDRLPGREQLFDARVRARVEKQLGQSVEKARRSILDQIEAAVAASVTQQTKRARVLLHGEDGNAR